MLKLTKEDFEIEYCNNDGMSIEEYYKTQVTLPCNCEYKDCKGFAAVSNNPRSIRLHNEICNRGNKIGDILTNYEDHAYGTIIEIVSIDDEKIGYKYIGDIDEDLLNEIFYDTKENLNITGFSK